MESLTGHDFKHKNGETTHYYEGGPKDGTPLIFLHGWPDIAESWKRQLSYFSQKSKYRVIAPDLRGYGGSTSPKDKRAYCLEVLVAEAIELADHLGVDKAVWLAHDWGCGVANSIAAHHPERFLGLALLSVPYRTIELGLNFIVTLVNRDLYPADEFEYGPWEYQRYYELYPEQSVKTFDSEIEKITKILYAKHDPSKWGQPAFTARIIRDGGWFGGHPEKLPDIPLAATALDQGLYDSLIRSHKKHGFFPPTAYYLNHDVNVEFAKSEKNGGVLEFPVLYVDAKHDAVCSPSVSPKNAEPQKEFTRNLTYETIEAGHWVHLEKPEETNKAIEKWLGERIKA